MPMSGHYGWFFSHPQFHKNGTDVLSVFFCDYVFASCKFPRLWHVYQDFFFLTTNTTHKNSANPLHFLRQRNQKEHYTTMQIDQSIILKKIVEFPRHNVSVVEQRIEGVGSSLFYVAEEKPQRKSFSGSSFLIKVSVASTQEQARRAAAEVRALRRVRDHPTILEMIDSGCSAMNQAIGENKEDDAEAPLDEDRMYCLLFKECPQLSVRDIMEKHRCLKSTWMNIKIVMGIFRQMALAVSVLHAKESRVIHMDLRPDHFGLCKPSKEEATSCKYMVKLIGAGCAVEGSMSLASTSYRNRASRLINATTSKRYRAPEMVNLFLANELTDK